MSKKILGILGGGQLGRMSALAAARLGIETIIYCPEQNCPASYVSSGTYFAPYEDEAALEEFAGMVDVITYEFENIPLKTVEFLLKFKPVYPDLKALEVAQDRLVEKKFLNDIGIPTTRWKEVNSAVEITAVTEEWDAERILLKTTRLGYDGKGQRPYYVGEDPGESWSRLGETTLIAEEFIEFREEVSIVVARDKLGQVTMYGPMENEHRDGILHKTFMPARIDDSVAADAKRKAQLLAEALDLVGVLAIEFFVTHDDVVLANEIAPRPHNSGHWTIDACAVSQFENHVRTVCSYNVGSAARHSNAMMRNLIGDEILEGPKLMESEHTCVHNYGKTEIRPGRKMGHVTVLKEKV